MSGKSKSKRLTSTAGKIPRARARSSAKRLTSTTGHVKTRARSAARHQIKRKAAPGAKTKRRTGRRASSR